MPEVAKWTNGSVKRFAGGGDPIEAIEQRAREVALSAMDKGWSGPPFDPIQLADLLHIDVVARAEVSDARIVPTRTGKLQIEFNPNRPNGRIRFSIAHEIVHSFFPDCSQRIRHRAPSSVGDNWQLELLCNVGAAELLMPAGSFDRRLTSDISIERILELRRQYDVSTEALLIRLSKLVDAPLAAFAAAHIEAGPEEGRYRLDYLMPSRTWPYRRLRGVLLPERTIASECTAIGYTSKGVEAWPGCTSRLSIECVGIPPFPGSTRPRVVGIARAGKAVQSAPQIIYLMGDALSPRTDGKRILAHVVNDKTANWGGGGFAAAVRKRLRVVQDSFREWAYEAENNLKLGNVHYCEAHDDLTVASMIAQHGYGPSACPRIRYRALERCLVDLSKKASRENSSIHMPRIGAGQAGGSWPIIEELISELLVRKGISVYVYTLPN